MQVVKEIVKHIWNQYITLIWNKWKCECKTHCGLLFQHQQKFCGVKNSINLTLISKGDMMEATVLVIVLLWTNLLWFPQILDPLLDYPYIIPQKCMPYLPWNPSVVLPVQEKSMKCNVNALRCQWKKHAFISKLVHQKVRLFTRQLQICKEQVTGDGILFFEILLNLFFFVWNHWRI